MIIKSYFIVIILFLFYSCNKTSNVNQYPTDSFNQIITESDSVNVDSLRILFNDIHIFKKKYSYRFNLNNNYPEFIARIYKLNDSLNSKYYNGLIRLTEIYSKVRSGSTAEIDSINTLIFNKIFPEKELSKIRYLYKSKIIIDSTKSVDYNIKKLNEMYHEIDYYHKEYVYFRDSLVSKFWELCPIYYELLRKKATLNSFRNDSLKNQLLSVKTTNSENETFIKSIIQAQIDTLNPSFYSTIAPIIELNDNSKVIYNTDLKFFADNELFQESYIYKEIYDENANYSSGLMEDKLILNSKYAIEIFAYSAIGRYKIEDLSFGYQQNECIGSFYVFPIKNVSDKVLFSSTLQLEIEYENYPRIDSLIVNEYPDICNDCPSGWSHLKTFGKLKGYENVYFATTRIQEFDDTETLIRAIFLITKENEVIRLWSSEFDSFGCACL